MQNCWKCRPTLVCDFTYVKVNKSVNISLLLCLALFWPKMSINMHALKFRIQSNSGNYTALGAEGKTYVGWQNFFTVALINLRRALRVPAVRILFGSDACPASSMAPAPVLTYLIGARAQVHYSRRKHSLSRRYNSTIQDSSFIAPYTVIILGLQQTIRSMHPTLSCFLCHALSCLANLSVIFLSCVFMCCNLVLQFHVLHFHTPGF